MNEPTETPRRNLTGAVVPAIAAAALTAVGAIVLVGVNGGGARVEAVPAGCILDDAVELGGPIDLVDTNGSHVTQADFAGAPALVYFGFTNCPAICPTSMLTVNEALAQPDVPDVQPILVTVDPRRDTPQRMREYVATDGFPTTLVGLTGSQQQVDAALSEFHAYGRALPPADPAAPNVYDVDHSSFLYVLDGQWRPVAAIRTMGRQNEADPTSPIVPISPQDIAACIRVGLDRGRTAS
jgi:protein SCO1/2